MTIILLGQEYSFPWSTIIPSSISAFAALVSTIFLIFNSIHQNKKNKENQARTISAWPAIIDGQYKIVIQNSSNSPIYNVIAVTASINKSSVPNDGGEAIKFVGEERFNSEITYFLFNQVPPGTFAKPKKYGFHLSMQVELGIEIAFTDVFENHWLVNTNGQLKRLHSDYLYKRYGIDEPVDWDRIEYTKDRVK